MKVVDQVIGRLSPLLSAHGFGRRGRNFILNTGQAVAGVRVQKSRYAQKVAIRAGVMYVEWAQCLSATRSLSNPVDHMDRSIVMLDRASPFPNHEKWWDLEQPRRLGEVLEELGGAFVSETLPAILAAMSPAWDRDDLLRLWKANACPEELLPRLYFWLVTLGPDAELGEARAIREAALRGGRFAPEVARVDEWLRQ